MDLETCPPTWPQLVWTTLKENPNPEASQPTGNLLAALILYHSATAKGETGSEALRMATAQMQASVEALRSLAAV